MDLRTGPPHTATRPHPHVRHNTGDVGCASDLSTSVELHALDIGMEGPTHSSSAASPGARPFPRSVVPGYSVDGRSDGGAQVRPSQMDDVVSTPRRSMSADGPATSANAVPKSASGARRGFLRRSRRKARRMRVLCYSHEFDGAGNFHPVRWQLPFDVLRNVSGPLHPPPPAVSSRAPPHLPPLPLPPPSSGPHDPTTNGSLPPGSFLWFHLEIPRTCPSLSTAAKQAIALLHPPLVLQDVTTLFSNGPFCGMLGGALVFRMNSPGPMDSPYTFRLAVRMTPHSVVSVALGDVPHLRLNRVDPAAALTSPGGGVGGGLEGLLHSPRGSAASWQQAGEAAVAAAASSAAAAAAAATAAVAATAAAGMRAVLNAGAPGGPVGQPDGLRRSSSTGRPASPKFEHRGAEQETSAEGRADDHEGNVEMKAVDVPSASGSSGAVLSSISPQPRPAESGMAARQQTRAAVRAPRGAAGSGGVSGVRGGRGTARGRDGGAGATCRDGAATAALESLTSEEEDNDSDSNPERTALLSHDVRLTPPLSAATATAAAASNWRWVAPASASQLQQQQQQSAQEQQQVYENGWTTGEDLSGGDCSEDEGVEAGEHHHRVPSWGLDDDIPVPAFPIDEQVLEELLRKSHPEHADCAIPLSAFELLEHVVESHVDHLLDAAVELEMMLEVLEHQIDTGTDRRMDLLKDRTFPKLHLDLQRLLQAIAHVEVVLPKLKDRLLAKRWCSAEQANMVEGLMARLRRTKENVGFLASRITALQAGLEGWQAEQINRKLYYLSFLSMVFLPISVITGLFGMNVGGVPWVPQTTDDPDELAGFMNVVWMCAAIIVFMFAAFFAGPLFSLPWLRHAGPAAVALCSAVAACAQATWAVAAPLAVWAWRSAVAAWEKRAADRVAKAKAKEDEAV